MAKRAEEIDWEGLLTVGSLVGSILQISQKAELEQKLNLSMQEAEVLRADRERVVQGLRQLQAAYQTLKADAESIRAKNTEPLALLRNRDQELQDLNEQLVQALRQGSAEDTGTQT